ncbi:MAG: THUMP domain-containing protein [Thermoplasmata archaeon]
MKFLLRYGEMGLKGRPVQAQWKRRLRDNIVRLFREHGAGAVVFEEEGRLFVESEHPAAPELLGRVFGLVSFSPIRETDAEIEAVSALAILLAGELRGEGPAFAVRTRRVGEHPFTSNDVARAVGAAILARFPELGVNLKGPDWEVHVEIRGEKAYLYADLLPGVGGLPLGTQGKVVTLAETPEGAMASWLMMKRGCYVLPVFRGDERWAATLRSWDPDVRWQAIESLAEMQEVAEAEGALGFVYPWTSSEASKEDLRPAFYPLMGLDPKRLEGLRATLLGPAGPA